MSPVTTKPTAAGRPPIRPAPSSPTDRSDRRRRAASHPDPARLARAVARAFLEVEAGLRPLRQLEPVLAPALVQRLTRLLHTTPRRPMSPQRTAVLRMTTCWLTTDAFEACVIVQRAGRVGALTLRVERHRGAWRIADLARPEDGMPPVRTGALPNAGPLPDAFDETADPEDAPSDDAAGHDDAAVPTE